MLAARRFLVSGRVQGVGFRYFTQEAAEVEGMSGWVRNLPDGRVEVLAEGDAEALERFALKLARGPAMARVDVVETSEETPYGRGGNFTVK
ncbi:MAG TPA: acylphosphatase [Vicinamibacterales bacterium]|nr:acylphosphatase [Vicinamibacterales bacterium]